VFSHNSFLFVGGKGIPKIFAAKNKKGETDKNESEPYNNQGKAIIH